MPEAGVAWKDSYSLGNEQIDLQHKKLFELINGLVVACLEKRSQEKLQETLTFLGNYVVQHFYFEEELQLRHNYPERDRHIQLHKDFMQTVGELTAKFKKNGSSSKLSSDVNKIVVRWLINHILREDKKIGEYIRSVADKPG